MAQITRLKLSGSTDGRNILVVATASPGTLIHTSSVSSLDELYIDVANLGSVNLDIIMQIGGTAASDFVTLTLQPKTGFRHMLTGISLTNGLILRAFASAASAMVVNGYVLRVT